jgi:ABC-type antimicrobial peptide transport system permease subunit
MKSPDFHGKLDVLKNMLTDAGAITDIAQASSPVTGIWNNANNFTWAGKDPALTSAFATIMITPTYGKTIHWTITRGRDLQETDTTAVILNEAAVKYMNIKEPIGMEIGWGKHAFHVVGIVKDILAGSPYEPIRPGIYFRNEKRSEWMLLRLNPEQSAHESLATIEAAFKKVIPTAPFEYRFVDDDYGRKFDTERRAGSLALVFTVLAIFISCLGLFGLAAFIAGQKAKEIGIRKVMGASVSSVWGLLSRDFVILVLIACAIAVPLSLYIMSGWLGKYTYHAPLSWVIFAVTVGGAVSITLVTVSFQAIRAARVNPVKNLRAE